MLTTVCQGVQARFSPGLGLIIEPWIIGFDFPFPQRHPVRPPLPNYDSNIEHSVRKEANNQNLITNKEFEKEYNGEINKRNCAKREGPRGWSFLQALSETTREDTEVYVHPLVKRSASMLSEKSLEMCTENLGSETGSSVGDNGEELMRFSGSETERSTTKMGCFGGRKRSNGTANFPPPLTTISGGCAGGGFRVTTQREGGRLIMEAVSVVTQESCFKTQRSEGRLRLHLVDPNSCSIHHGDDDVDDDDDDDDVDDDDDGGEVEDEVEVGNISMPRRCKEGQSINKGIIFNLEPCSVIT